MNFTAEELEAAQRSAKYVTLTSPHFYDDVLGELNLWLCKHYKKVLEYRNDPKPEEGRKKLYSALRYTGYDERQKLVNISEGRDKNMNHDGTWETEEIKKILAKFGDDNDDDATDDVRVVIRAYSSLTETHKQILEISYIQGNTIKETQKLTGRTYEGVREARKVALRKLKQKLNGYRTFGLDNIYPSYDRELEDYPY